jgi:hypothetical protein
MLLKKSQRMVVANNETEGVEEQKSSKIGKDISPHSGQAEATDASDTTADTRVRLSADIEHKAYIKLKTYAAVVRKPVVSIVQSLIYSNCNVIAEVRSYYH